MHPAILPLIGLFVIFLIMSASLIAINKKYAPMGTRLFVIVFCIGIVFVIADVAWFYIRVGNPFLSDASRAALAAEPESPWFSTAAQGVAMVAVTLVFGWACYWIGRRGIRRAVTFELIGAVITSPIAATLLRGKRFSFVEIHSHCYLFRFDGEDIVRAYFATLPVGSVSKGLHYTFDEQGLPKQLVK